MKKILITSYNMSIGGVERSLIGLLDTIDYRQYAVDLFLFGHSGELFHNLPNRGYRLLPEIPQYAIYGKSVKQIFLSGQCRLALVRAINRIKASRQTSPPGKDNCQAVQHQWDGVIDYLPPLEGIYDVAIGYQWPHDCVIQKVHARKKIGWIHTDYSSIYVDKDRDLQLWDRLDHIIAVSNGCRDSFLSAYPALARKVAVMENIVSPDFIRGQAVGDVSDEMPCDGAIKLLSIGRFSYAKAFDRAVAVCHSLIEDGLNVKWYLIGFGGQEGSITAAIQQYGLADRFIMLGKKLNPYPYLRACDIYVQPSRYEGKAVTVQEAQILHKPVLITDFPSAQCQLRNGIDGCIVPNSPEGIVQGIKNLVADADLRNRLADNTRSIDYSNRQSVQTLYELLNG